jgi:sulfur dioxygenase
VPQLLFRQLIDPTSSTYTYLLADPTKSEAVLIDPVFEQTNRDIALLDELGLKLVATLETHVHADHVTGGARLRHHFGSQVILAAASGAEDADRYVGQDQLIRFGDRSLTVRATPGHTNGCISYVLDDESMVFTGDALLIRGCGRTDFQQGSAATLFDSVHSQIFSLPDACTIYPGHDYRGLTASSVGEEKQHNPRLGRKILRDDFVGYMSNLGLPHPKQMDIAVPANLACGRPEDGAFPATTPDWAELTYTFAGIWEVEPNWLCENAASVYVLDVREEVEFSGTLGHVDGAELMPLKTLMDNTEKLPKDKPVVVVCRSGARSAQATVLLKKAGFDRVANMSGGMLRWQEQRLPAVDVNRS